MNTMDNIVQADIFFFVASILLTIATVVFIVAIVYVIKILREARSIAGVIRRETETIAADFESLRERMRDNGISPGKAFSFVSGFFKRGRGRKGRS